MLQHGAAQRRLAHADVAAQDAQRLAATDSREQRIERCRMRVAVVEKRRIGREAERLLLEPVKGLVRQLRRAAMVKAQAELGDRSGSISRHSYPASVKRMTDASAEECPRVQSRAVSDGYLCVQREH